MAWIGAAIRAGSSLAGRRSGRRTTPGSRKPRPIGGPGRGRRPGRKLTTSQAAIRRFEEMKRKKAGTGRGPRKPSRSVNTGPISRGPKRPSRSVNTGSTSRGPRRKSSSTSRIAIARSRNRLGPASSRRKSVGRFGRRVARSVLGRRR